MKAEYKFVEVHVGGAGEHGGNGGDGFVLVGWIGS